MPVELQQRDSITGTGQFHTQRRLIHAARMMRGAAITVMLMGGMVLLGWLLNIPFFKSILPGLTSTKANTAVCFVLAGAALWLLRDEPAASSRRRLARMLALAILIMGALNLAEYLFGLNFGIDELLFRERVASPGTLFPGRMAHATALSFVLLGLALWLMSRSRYPVLMQSMVLVVLCIALLALAGYLYESEMMYSVFALSSVALPTALMLFICGAGILLARPDQGVMAVITSDKGGGRMARRLIPAAIVFPFLIGWLRLTGQYQGLYQTEFGVALFAVSTTLTFVVLIWWNARSLNRLDLERQNAEAAMLKNESRYHRILDSLREGAQIIDSDWRYLYLNDAAAHQGQQPAEALVGYTMLEKYPGIETTPMFAMLRRCMEERIAQQMDNEFVYPDGTSAWFELSVQPVEDGVFVLSLDITARKQAEVGLRRYARRLEMLHQIDQGLIHGDSIQVLVATTLKHLRDLIPCQHAAVGIIDQATDEAIIFANDLTGDTALAEGKRVKIPSFAREGHDARNMKVLDDIRPFVDASPQLKQLAQEGMLSALQVLLMEHDHPIGSMALMANTPAFFTPEYQEIAVQVASQLALAVHQLHLTDDLARHTAELEQRVAERTAELHAGKAQVEAILNNSPDGILLVNIEQGIQQTNAAFNSVFACKWDAYFGKSLFSLIQADDAEAVNLLIQQVTTEKQRRHVEIRAVRQDGVAFDAELNIGFIKDSELVCVFRDITERKAQERQLRFDASVQKQLSDAIISTDLQFVIQSWNHGAEAIYGWRADEAIGRTIDALLQAQLEDSGGRERLRQYFLDRGHWHGDVEQFRKDDSKVQVRGSVTRLDDEHGMPYGFTSVFRDVTAIKAQERQLRFHASLQENVSEAVIVTDMDFRIQSWNKAAERIYGWNAEEVAGKSVLEIWRTQLSSPDERTQNIQQLLDQGWWQREVMQHHQDGRELHMFVSVTLVKDEQGKPFGMVSVNHDISEQKAQERQLRYQASLQENVSDAVIVTDLTFRIRSWNRAAERIYGWRADEVMDKSVAEVLRTEMQPVERDRSVGQLRDQGWWQGEVIQRHRDGSIRHILGSVTQVKDENGVPFRIVSVNHDITERKQVEEALQKAAAEVLDLYNNAPCGYHSIDRDGVIVQMNDTELRWLGYERDEVLNKLKITDIFAPESVARFQAQFPLFKERGWVSDLEFDVVRKDGRLMHILLNGTAIYDEAGQYLKSRTTLFDITELKRAQQARVESESRYRLLAENVTDVIARVSMDGIRTFVTPSCYDLVGYTPEEITDKPAFAIVHPDDRAPAIAIMEQAIREDRASYSMIQRVRHKAGHYVPVEVTATIVRDPVTGRPLENIGVIRDITERKRAEDALLRSEQMLLNVLENIPVRIFWKDRNSVYQGCNSLYARHLGLAIPEQIIGKTDRHFNPARAAKWEDEDRQVMTTGQPLLNMEEFITERDGHQRWLRSSKLVLRGASGETDGVLVTVEDITTRKQAELAVAEERNLLRTLIDAVPDFIYIKDMQHRFMLTNAAHARARGAATPDELTGKTDLDFFPADLAAQFHLEEAHILETGVPLLDHEQMSLGHAGGFTWAASTKVPLRNMSGELIGLVGITRDITERRRIAAELEEQRTFLRNVIDVSPNLIFVKDYDSRYVLANPSVAKLYNTTVEALIGRTVIEFNASDSQVIEMLQADRRVIESGETLYVEEPITNAAGEIRWFQTTKVPVVSADSRSKFVLGVATDITDQKQAEGALRQALATEKELNELKTRFVSMASHEFRTPLATILAATETLMAYRQKMSEEQIVGRLSKIQEQVEHLKDIMEDVLMLARMQARRVEFNPVPLNLDALCLSVLDEFQSRPDIAHQFDYRCDEQLHHVVLDKKLLRHIINNLISNAVKYSPPDEPIDVHLACRDSALVLQVRDRGIGIPEDDQKHLFEPFHRAANVGTISGTGLGLVITSESVALHNGMIQVDSHVGTGTVFTVTIPLSTAGEAHHDENSGH